MLMQSTLYTPVVLAAAIVVDFIITSNNYDLSTTLASEFVLTQGYLIIAVALRDFFAFDFREASYANAIALLAVAPARRRLHGLALLHRSVCRRRALRRASFSRA